jgi:hypothetical protein
MGASESTPSDSSSNLIVEKSDTNNKINNDSLTEDYKRDKAEIQSTLEQVAAQVYDNVHSQLESIQTAQLQQAQQFANNIENKLSNSITTEKKCQTEEKSLINCLQNGDILKCTELIDNLSKCASSSVAK